MFLSPEPYVSNGSGIDALPLDMGTGLDTLERSREDILSLLKAFVTVIPLMPMR